MEKSIQIILIMKNTVNSTVKYIPPVSQTRLKPSPRLKCKSELFQLK